MGPYYPLAVFTSSLCTRLFRHSFCQAKTDAGDLEPGLGITEDRLVTEIEEEIAKARIPVARPLQHQLGRFRELWLELPEKTFCMLLRMGHCTLSPISLAIVAARRVPQTVEIGRREESWGRGFTRAPTR